VRSGWFAAGALAVAFAVPVPASAQGPLGAPNDLLALGQGGGQTPDAVPVQKPAAPPLDATPRAQCGPGSKPEPDIQGRVPAGSATDGLWCNVTMIGHEGTTGGFKVFRYIDPAGHECAFYDQTLMFPLNALEFNANSLGVAVLDMTDPSHPVKTDTLTEPAMLTPHESLNLNAQRGLLAAVSGNAGTYPGLFSVYDVSKDCRHPVLDFSGPIARLGHESGFSPDGKTFYAAGTAYQAITAIDLTDPKAPHDIWQGNVLSHGMTIGDDGNRAYIADPVPSNGITNGLLILDISEIQARKANPQAHEISRLTWDKVSIPQNAIPFTSHGHPYLLEFDEYNAGTLQTGSSDDVGAGRIIDIADERQPRVVSNLRLQIDNPADHAKYSGYGNGNADPGASGSPQGYAAHYCNISSSVDPQLVACSFIASGLRIFNISDVTAPREVGYFVAPTKAGATNAYQASDFAMSKPAFVPERREIWYSDGPSGFYALRVSPGIWPQETPAPKPTKPSACKAREHGRFTVRLPRGAKFSRLRASVRGHKVGIDSRRHRGRTLRVTVDLPKRAGTVVFHVRLRSGRTLTFRRAFKQC
jgi:hypothetical protein